MNISVKEKEGVGHECKAAPRKLALAGNPNVGKSVVFQALTGMYAEVSNYPGTTVDVTTGSFGPFTLIDTPGVFSLSGFNDEEQVTLSAVTDCDCILNVVDGTHLERDLFLTLQLLSLGKPMLVAVNLMDQVEKNRIRLDLSGLSAALGVEIFPVSAKKGTGIKALRSALSAGSLRTPARGRVRGEDPGISDDGASARTRLEADRLAERFVRYSGQKTVFSQKLGRAVLNPVLGVPLMAGLLCLIFLFIGKFLSQTVVDFTEGYLMSECYYNFIFGLISRILDPDSFAGVLLIGEYGVLTMVPIYLLGLLLPLIVGFYLCLALLEDSGLLPRIAVLCDRLFTRFGLNGKAVIPMLLGFGCVTMALITTRILGTKRERLIATVLLCIAVPCSAQFAIIMAVASILPPFYFFIYGGSILMLFFLLGSLLARFLPGSSSDLFLVLPPLRLPGAKNVLRKTAMKSKHFLRDAGPMFLAGSLLISALTYTGGFAAIHQALIPLTVGFLKLPGETAALFLMSIIKRDLGAACLYSMVSQDLLSFPQMTVALTVITLFVPCFASVAILFKEQGPLAAAAIWLGSFAAAFLLGGLLAAWLV